LGETTENPTGLIPLQRAIRLELVLEYPLAGDDVGPRGSGHKIPSVILEEHTVFFHGCAPIGVGKRAAEVFGTAER
jgi:hypothetical protein